MAATRAPSDALTYVTAMVKNMPVMRDVAPSILQDASDYIWMSAPWRWTVGALTPTTVTVGVQTFNVTSPPADFMRLERAYVTNNVTSRPVVPVGFLPSAVLIQGQPNFVQYIDGGTPQIRFDTLFPPVGTEVWKFWAWYKKTSPDLLTDNGVPGALVMDDEWFWVYNQAVLYYTYLYADDQRAGGSTVMVSPQGQTQVQYNGQLGVVNAAINTMRLGELLVPTFPELNPNPMKLV